MSDLLADALQALRQRLPPRWQLEELRKLDGGTLDALAGIRAPDGTTCALSLVARARLDPKAAVALAAATREVRERMPLLVLSRYQSASSRDELRAHDINFLDLTGNARIAIAAPGLFIETTGASIDPDRKARATRSLRGAKAGRIVRALIDRKDPPGVRELAAATTIAAGYISRLLALLDREALIIRARYGRITSVDWPALLRRWATQSPLDARAEISAYAAPRGLATLRARLAKLDARYAITGELAASPLMIWVSHANNLAQQLGLRSTTDAPAADVLLLETSDDSAFAGATLLDGLWRAAPSQRAADLLHHDPEQAEALIQWMMKHEPEWRS